MPIDLLLVSSRRITIFTSLSTDIPESSTTLRLTFVADKPPPPHIAYQELLMAAETSTEYFS